MDIEFIKRIISKPPLIFPWVALFHLFMLGFNIWVFREFPFPSIYWLGVLWIFLNTVFWIFLCDLRRWAAYGYIALTALNLILHFTLKSSTDIDIYTNILFPVDILFCFFILFYFKRFS